MHGHSDQAAAVDLANARQTAGIEQARDERGVRGDVSKVKNGGRVGQDKLELNVT